MVEVTLEQMRDKILGIPRGVSEPFTAVFTKKDGSERTMRCVTDREGNGGTLGYNARERHLLSVWDVEAEGFRMVNADTTTRLEYDGEVYVRIEEEVEGEDWA